MKAHPKGPLCLRGWGEKSSQTAGGVLRRPTIGGSMMAQKEHVIKPWGYPLRSGWPHT